MRRKKQQALDMGFYQMIRPKETHVVVLAFFVVIVTLLAIGLILVLAPGGHILRDVFPYHIFRFLRKLI